MFHTPQTVTMRPRRTPQDSFPDSPVLICVLTTRPTPHFGKANLRRSCVPSLRISLYGSSVHNNVAEPAYEYTHRTLPNQLDHTIKNINSGIHIYLTTIKNTSLSHNSKYVHFFKNAPLNNPNFPRHLRRPPPVKAAISHGDSRDSLSNPVPPSTNCFVQNI